MRKSLLSSCLLIALGAAIWWMSANVVWLGDDLDYKFMMRGEIWQSWGRIRSAASFFHSQWIHYMNVNGRYVAHALVQLFNAFLGQQTFAACNAVAYMLFAWLLGKAGGVRIARNPSGLLSAACMAVLCFITKMMPTCQIGYIWAMTADMAWLTLFFRSGRPSILTTICMTCAGIVAGNWQESVSIGVCAGLGAWWIAQLAESRKKDKKKFDWRRSCMLAGYLAGAALDCLAPSTIGRTAGTGIPLCDQLLIASYSLPAVALLLIVLLSFRPRPSVREFFSFHMDGAVIPNAVLATGMLALLAFNLVIGIYSNRQLFGANLFAAILILRIIPHHSFRPILNAFVSIAVVSFWALMAVGIVDIRRQYQEIAELHAKSEDGGVSYDRTRVMTLGFPLRAKYYEDILGQFDNDLHHSLMKDFKHFRKGRTLKLKPTATLDREKSERYAPGHFTVTLKEPPKGEAPREVIVYGHYFVPGLSAAPRRLLVTRYSNRRPPYATAVIIPEFPFFTTDSVEIVPHLQPTVSD